MSNYIRNRPNQPLMGQAFYDEVLSRFQLNAAPGKTPVSDNSGTLGADWLPVVPVSKGGTGAANVQQALANLGGMPLSGGNFSGRTQFTAAGGAISATSAIGQAQLNSGNSASAAAITFNRSGYYVNLGLDTDNVLKVGGGSMGNVAYPILHSGNWANYISIPSYSGPLAPTTSGFVTLKADGSGIRVILPDGGTWAWFMLTYVPGDYGAIVGIGNTAGVSPGGTELRSPQNVAILGGFAWRIA